MTVPLTAFTAERWESLSLKTVSVPAITFDELSRRYSEPQRDYHNARHIDDCLREFDLVQHHAQNPNAVELAIWFHDAVYDPRASDNEEQSARLAVQALAAAPDLARVVSDLILTTKTHLSGSVPDAPLLLDIDLSILGQTPARFAEYETAIRREYEWVPLELYRQKRAEILTSFLQRPQIYLTRSFSHRYESAARQNISTAIPRL